VRDDRQPRVLISRLSHIGDCVLAIPMLNAVRRHYPKAFIAWVVERPSAPLLEGHESLDELIVLKRGWLKSPKTVWHLRRRLRRLRFDISIDPQCLTKSAVVGWLAGARTRVGFAGEDGRELSRWLNNRLVVRTEPHMVDRGLELLRPIGIERPKVRYLLPISSTAEAVAAELAELEENRQGFAVINPGAGWPSRLWPPQRYGQVAQYLWDKHMLRSVVAWYGDEERAMGDKRFNDASAGCVADKKELQANLDASKREVDIYKVELKKSNDSQSNPYIWASLGTIGGAAFTLLTVFAVTQVTK